MSIFKHLFGGKEQESKPLIEAGKQFKPPVVQEDHDEYYRYPYSKEWDETLNDILDKGKLINISQHLLHVKYKGQKLSIWLENYPYSFGSPCQFTDYRLEQDPVRPSLQTMDKLKFTVDKIRADEINEKYRKMREG